MCLVGTRKRPKLGRDEGFAGLPEEHQPQGVHPAALAFRPGEWQAFRAGVSYVFADVTLDQAIATIRAAVDAAVAAEREACAKVIEDQRTAPLAETAKGTYIDTREGAALIRARG
jgi:hypothetical protein